MDNRMDYIITRMNEVNSEISSNTKRIANMQETIDALNEENILGRQLLTTLTEELGMLLSEE